MENDRMDRSDEDSGPCILIDLPVCAAFRPGNLRSEGGEDVIEAVAEDDVVVDGDDDGDDALADADTIPQGQHVPDLDRPALKNKL